MKCCNKLLVCTTAVVLIHVLISSTASAQDLGARWGTEKRERDFYRLVDVPIPADTVVETGAFVTLPDDRIALGTRRGDIYILDGVDQQKPEPEFHLFASGLDEIFGLDYKDGSFYVTQSCELTRISDTTGNGRADQFETISDAWGYANYHEYAFGSKFDEQGNIFVALGLSQSYNSRALFRGWVIQVTPEGESIPIASGLRSPAGIGPNEHGALFYIESQGPWNSSNSLKAITPGSFMGHPISYNWYEFAPNMGPAPQVPNSGSRILIEKERVPQLIPYAVIFPYIRMGRSITGFTLDRSKGAFGPFEDQMFLGDYTLSIIMRATTEQVNGVWQGACYPFREGLSTGILNVHFTPEGRLICGGTNRGWPVRGIKPYALQRLEWTGVMPFEIKRINITSDGFKISFTKPVEKKCGSDPASYKVSTFTHIYHAGYGGPEVDQTTPAVKSVQLSEDGLEANIVLSEMKLGHVHEFHLDELRARDGEELLHKDAYYTVNAIPVGHTEREKVHPVPESPKWLVFPGGSGPGAGKHIVLIAADQEYRSEQSLPMLAKILSQRHGFHCTVLFSLNSNGEVDPTQEIKWQDDSVVHNIPGLEHLADADLMILFSRLITLPEDQLTHFYKYLDSGKPIAAFRTANHGFIGFDYLKNGDRINFGEDVLGGSFRNHHGRWHQDSTRGIIVDANKNHPLLRGVSEIWGPSDVYRTFPEGDEFPIECTPLVMGQPLMTREKNSPINRELIPLPVAWVKEWTGNGGKTARVFHSTMGSGKDFESAGLRRLAVNAVYWSLGLEAQITPEMNVDVVGTFNPLPSGFNYEQLGVRPHPPAYYK
ncbi:MAG: ThuA domain-containing protein [Planctomycetes bacterium]|nr:ThuA domain-containing protein [Planctomycetota bacterium]